MSVSVPLWACEDDAWTKAIKAFRQNKDRETLSNLVRYLLKHPEAAAHYVGLPTAEESDLIASIVAGRIGPDGRGRKRGDADPAQRAEAVASLLELRERRDAFSALRPLQEGRTTREISQAYEDAVENLARRYGVTRGTLETWARPSRR